MKIPTCACCLAAYLAALAAGPASGSPLSKESGPQHERLLFRRDDIFDSMPKPPSGTPPGKFTTKRIDPSITASATVLKEGDDEHDSHDGHDHDSHDSHDDDEKKKPWGAVIGWTFLVNLATLSGVIFLIPVASKKSRAWVKATFFNAKLPAGNNSSHRNTDEEFVDNHADDGNDRTVSSHFLDIIIPAFAAGALLATALFLVLPESIALITKAVDSMGGEEDDHDGHDHMRFLEGEEDNHDNHAGEIPPAVVWRFSSCLLAGFLLPPVFGLCFDKKKKELIAATEVPDKDENSVEIQEAAPAEEKKSMNWSLILSIIIGDGFHNFSDGVFVGTALLLCDKSTAYTIIFVTLYHEIAQELADYFLLTENVGMAPKNALILNFLSGITVTIGGLCVLLFPVSDMFVGAILAATAGLYFYIAGVECFPRMNEVSNSTFDQILALFAFMVGVVPIALALLNHQHCEVGHEDH